MKGFLTLLGILGLSLIFSCQPKETKLPILGEKEIIGKDTTFHRIPDFSFVNQDSQVVNNSTFAGKAYVADFFFTSCPTICPKTTKQMLRLYEKFEAEPRLLLLAHSIDTKNDTVPKLKAYADKLEVGSHKWHFITGDKGEIYDIADDYMSIAIEDPDAPGGFDHSGWLILIDENRHIRSFCDGTDPKSVDKFMDDINVLLEEMDQKKK